MIKTLWAWLDPKKNVKGQIGHTAKCWGHLCTFSLVLKTLKYNNSNSPTEDMLSIINLEKENTEQFTVSIYEIKKLFS